MVATASQPMTSLQDTDAPFAPDAPALTAAEPGLTFVRASRRRFGSTARQDDASHAAVGGGVFVGRRAEAPIARGKIRRAREDGLMSVQGWRPHRDVSWTTRVHLVGRDDLLFRFLNRDQVPKLVRLRDLALPNRRGMRFEDTEDLVRDMRVAAHPPCPRLRDGALDERAQLTQLSLGPFQH